MIIPNVILGGLLLGVFVIACAAVLLGLIILLLKGAAAIMGAISDRRERKGQQ